MAGTATQVLQLFPGPAGPRELKGLYLAHDLRERATGGEPFVYTNFIGSLDGRISWKGPRGYREVPPACANPHDLRLYYELSAQADVLVTTSHHLHGAAAGRASGMLTFGDCAEELVAWRRARGLKPYPRIVAVTGSLHLPDRARLDAALGEITLLTWGTPGRDARERVASQGYRLVVCGTESRIDGDDLVAAIGDCRTLYSVAGPRVHSALLQAGRLHRLYLTIVQTLLAGDEFDTLTLGGHLDPPAAFPLAELYHDAAEPPGSGQLFGVFDAGDSPVSARNAEAPRP